MHAHAVAGIFEMLDARHRRTLGLERARACRHHHHGSDDFSAGVGLQLPAAVLQFFQADRHLPEMKLRIEGLDLLQQSVDQFLAGDDGQPRNVVDRFFGIKLGALAAGAVQNVDQVALQIQQSQLEHGEQTDGAGADNGNIGFDGGSSHSQYLWCIPHLT